MAMDRLFQLMKEKNASDMFFAVNSPVHIKINGNLIPINQHKLEQDNIASLLSEVATPEQTDQLPDQPIDAQWRDQCERPGLPDTAELTYRRRRGHPSDGDEPPMIQTQHDR